MRNLSSPLWQSIHWPQIIPSTLVKFCAAVPIKYWRALMKSGLGRKPLLIGLLWVLLLTCTVVVADPMVVDSRSQCSGSFTALYKESEQQFFAQFPAAQSAIQCRKLVLQKAISSCSPIVLSVEYAGTLRPADGAKNSNTYGDDLFKGQMRCPQSEAAANIK